MAPLRDDTDKVRRTAQVHDEAVEERRHWVRIAYACNNRCRFCLDAYLRPEGPFLSTAEVKDKLQSGIRNGATRLILSGGEASIHPEFVDFVSYGKKIGYQHVQTISNGRMFCYPRFLQRARRAGLDEITFSLHSHRPEVHDDLSGVSGAFRQAITGLRRALRVPGLVVSVDIVINRLNVDALADTVQWFSDEGVGEFDLLYLVPFGRAFDSREQRVPLAAPAPALARSLARTLELARRRSLVIWTNRVPASALEGNEHLIQDPRKLEDEVRGRREHLTRLVEHGEPLRCRDVRCHECYLRHFCDVVHPLQERVAREEIPRLRITLSGESPLPSLAGWSGALERLWVRAPDVDTALQLQPPGGDSPVEETWELQDYTGLLSRSGRSRDDLTRRRIRRAVVTSVSDLERALSAGLPEVKLLLSRETWAWVKAQAGALPEALVLGASPPQSLSEAVDRGIDLQDPQLRRLADAGLRIEDLPPCLGGVLEDGPVAGYLDLDALDEQGRLNPDRWVRHYIAEHYRCRSHRCRSCVHRPRCPGLHVNWVRSQGFGLLRPVR
jgi:molybdenum cofactor biosynthesis enzyme MoaA